jgi:hypothetical protein
VIENLANALACGLDICSEELPDPHCTYEASVPITRWSYGFHVFVLDKFIADMDTQAIMKSQHYIFDNTSISFVQYPIVIIINSFREE